TPRSASLKSPAPALLISLDAPRLVAHAGIIANLSLSRVELRDVHIEIVSPGRSDRRPESPTQARVRHERRRWPLLALGAQAPRPPGRALQGRRRHARDARRRAKAALYGDASPAVRRGFPARGSRRRRARSRVRRRQPPR